MRTINQRELRNESAEVMRAVERGETFTVTRRGVPIARVTPIPEGGDLRCIRPARRRPVYSATSRITTSTPTAAILADLRGER